MISQFSLGFSSVQLIASLAGDTINSCGEQFTGHVGTHVIRYTDYIFVYSVYSLVELNSLHHTHMHIHTHTHAHTHLRTHSLTSQFIRSTIPNNG